MTAGRVSVLVVDDSAFARKVLSELLSNDGRIAVVGTARDGLDALEKIAALAPDVVTLDLMMPHLDGLGVLRGLPASRAPRIVLVSMSAADSDLVLDGLELGAVDFVRKPSALATDRLYEIGAELVRKVLTAAGARPHPRPAQPPPPLPPPPPMRRRLGRRVEAVVVGTSTGGPQALAGLLGALPSTFPLPIAIALHIPADYTAALADRLGRLSPLEVLEASDGMVMRPGRAILARGGTHLALERREGVVACRLDVSGPSPYRPSVDLLFRSAVEACGSVAGVVLTGMGDDGLRGAGAIRAGGGVVLVEAEASCVVYGMPRAVKLAGLADREATLERMASTLVEATTEQDDAGGGALP